MELAPYGELFSFMKNEGVLEFRHAQFFAAEIVNMIEYLHENRICHRDMKPSNILFDSNMHLKLADFGAGKVFKNSDETFEENGDDHQSGGSNEKKEMIKRTNTFVGTCEYMSPESILGKCKKNECDLWALGVIIYKMFSEYSPFIGEFDEDTIQKIEEDPVIFPQGFPELAQDLWIKLLEKDPADRIGWGNPGTERDMFSLKAHPFFDGIDFENLHKWDSPAPIPCIHRASIKTRIIDEYKRSAITHGDNSSPAVMDHIDFTTSSSVSQKNNLKDWETGNSVILYQGPLKYRSRLLIMFKSVTAILSDEPVLYLYKKSTGALKGKYDVKNYYLVQKSKTKFKLVKNGDNEYRHISNKFKIVTRKMTELDQNSSVDLLTLLGKYWIKGSSKA